VRGRQEGSVAKFDFWGEIQKLGIRNSMTYRLPKSRKSNFATEPSRLPTLGTLACATPSNDGAALGHQLLTNSVPGCRPRGPCARGPCSAGGYEKSGPGNEGEEPRERSHAYHSDNIICPSLDSAIQVPCAVLRGRQRTV